MTWLLKKALGMFGLNQIALITIGLLLASTAGAGYLLKQSYKSNGEQKALLLINKSNLAAQKQVIEFEREQYAHLQQKLIDRENDYLEIDFELNNVRKELNELPDKSGCLDVDLGSDYWLSIYPADSNN